MNVRAAIYLRQSLDQNGDRAAVDRQEKACRELATRRGWPVQRTYTDNSISASSGRYRPGYEAMLADIAAGSINAVLAWHPDRLHRRPIELEKFVELVEAHGVRVATVEAGEVDLASPSGQLYARQLGSVARFESQHKSQRQKAANAQRRENGRMHTGRRAFGYTSDGTGIVESEAAQLRWAAGQIINGISLKAVCRELGARGVTTTAGGAWRPTEIRRALLNPRYIAQVVHAGQIIGKGEWPAILDEDTHATLRAFLEGRAGTPGRPRRHLLSGLARCGVCGAKVYCAAGGSRDREAYFCSAVRHLNRRADQAEDYVTGLVLARLARPDAAELFTTQDSRSEVRVLRARQQTLRARLDALSLAFAKGQIDAQQLSTGSKQLRGDIGDVTVQLAGLLDRPLILDLSKAPEQVWARLDVESRAAVIDVLMTVTLHPPGRGARVFDPGTVEIAWKQG